MDEEVVAWKTLKFWRDGQPFLIGGGTPFGFHLGPAFYYLSTIPLIFTRGDPIGWMFLIAIVSISNLYLIWLVGKTLYSETVGLIAAAFWAFSFTTVMFDRHWWPLILDPLFSLLTMLSLFQILKGKSRWWIVLGVTLSFAWQADLTNLVLFLAAGAVAVVTFKTQWKHVVAALGILVVSLTPFVVFELRHPGANLGKVFSYRVQFRESAETPILETLRSVQFAPKALAKLLLPSPSSTNLSTLYTWCKDVASRRVDGAPIDWIISTLILVVPIWHFWRKRKTNDGVVLAIILSGIMGILLFRIQGGDLFDFYLAPLYPVFFIATAVFIASFMHSLGEKKRLSWMERRYPMIYRRAKPSALTTILIALFALHIFSVLGARHPQSLAVKQQAVAWVTEQVGDRPFALDSLSRCHRYNGIRYLFMLDGHEPVMSFMDPNYAWLYDEPPASTQRGEPATSYPPIFVAFVTPNDLTAVDESRYNELKRRAIDSKQFGDFDVLIADNRDHAFSIDF